MIGDDTDRPSDSYNEAKEVEEYRYKALQGASIPARAVTVRQRVDEEIKQLQKRITALEGLKAALDAAPETEKVLDAMRKLGI